VGPGGSLKAAFALRASVPAGVYHVECDALVIAPIDVTFTLLWRRGPLDTQLAQWTQHFDPLPGPLAAQPYEHDVTAAAIDHVGGDQLVFGYAGPNPMASTTMTFIPNGDGKNAGGRIPSITLPPP
jgi:hypothetical protein